MRPAPLGIDFDGTGSDELKSTFTLCLKCHDRTRFVAHFGVKNNAAQWGENARPNESSLDSRYGEIGIPAVAAALPYRSEVKNPAYAPAVHRPQKWTAGMAA